MAKGLPKATAAAAVVALGGEEDVATVGKGEEEKVEVVEEAGFAVVVALAIAGIVGSFSAI